jgi:hypothetical protein
VREIGVRRLQTGKDNGAPSRVVGWATRPAIAGMRSWELLKWPALGVEYSPSTHNFPTTPHKPKGGLYGPPAFTLATEDFVRKLPVFIAQKLEDDGSVSQRKYKMNAVIVRRLNGRYAGHQIRVCGLRQNLELRPGASAAHRCFANSNSGMPKKSPIRSVGR